MLFIKLLNIIIIFLLFSNYSFQQENKGITEERINRIIKEAEIIRGLSAKKSIGFKLLNKNQIRDFIVDQIHKEYSDEDLKNEETFLKILGLVPEDFKLGNFYIDLYTEQAAGIYDYTSKNFYIADWMPDFLLDPVIFHEAIHALDDQYFDLQNYFHKGLSNDEKFARAAIIEGEGTYFMLKYLLNSIGGEMDKNIDYDSFSDLFENLPLLPQTEVVSKAPNFIKNQMLFPYIKGMSFISNFLEKHSLKDLSLLYKNPPESSEQILHPEKYRKDKPHIKIIKTPIIFEGWKYIYCNNVGEYALFVVLKENLPKEVSQKAADGWGGDFFCIIQKDNKQAVVFRSSWDNEKEAKEFYLALSQWLNFQDLPKDNILWQENKNKNTLAVVENNYVNWIIGKINKPSALKVIKFVNNY